MTERDLPDTIPGGCPHDWSGQEGRCAKCGVRPDMVDAGYDLGPDARMLCQGTFGDPHPLERMEHVNSQGNSERVLRRWKCPRCGGEAHQDVRLPGQ